jgi:hypothetical protein
MSLTFLSLLFIFKSTSCGCRKSQTSFLSILDYLLTRIEKQEGYNSLPKITYDWRVKIMIINNGLPRVN